MGTTPESGTNSRSDISELDGNKESVELILQKLRSGSSVFLLYGTKDEQFNNAVALKEYLLRKLDKYFRDGK